MRVSLLSGRDFFNVIYGILVCKYMLYLHWLVGRRERRERGKTIGRRLQIQKYSIGCSTPVFHSSCCHYNYFNGNNGKICKNHNNFAAFLSKLSVF
jgi:hypothetical protein